jgi:hypothetical protein
VVAIFVDPQVVPSAREVLSEFQEEMFPLPAAGGGPNLFRVEFVHWGPFGVVAVAVFPREGIDRLSQICMANSLILVRAALAADDPIRRTRHVFDAAAAVPGLCPAIPTAEATYTIKVRPSDDSPLIACGLHDWDSPSGQRRSVCNCGGAHLHAMD